MTSQAILPDAHPLTRTGIYRILVCRPNHRLGNMLLMTPLIEELQRQFNGAEIDIVAEGDAARDIFARHAHVRHVFCLPRPAFKHPLQLIRLLRRLRRHPYDLVIDPCLGSRSSRLLARCSRGRQTLGYDADPAAPGLSRIVAPGLAPRHMAEIPVGLIRHALGLDMGSGTAQRLDIRLSPDELESGRQTLQGLLPWSAALVQPPVIAVYAEATGRKRYGDEWWRAFIQVLSGMLPEGRIIEIVPAHGRSMLNSSLPAYYSSHLRRLAGVMAAADLVISADCGVMHLAVAAQARTMGLFCATSAEKYQPCGGLNTALLTHGLDPAEVAHRVVASHGELFRRPHWRPADDSPADEDLAQRLPQPV
ncbi:glycosyltransferase family 9 protein [Frateuria aurantia]